MQVDFCDMGKKQGANGADGGSPASPWGIVLEGRRNEDPV